MGVRLLNLPPTVSIRMERDQPGKLVRPKGPASSSLALTAIFYHGHVHYLGHVHNVVNVRADGEVATLTAATRLFGGSNPPLPSIGDWAQGEPSGFDPLEVGSIPTSPANRS